MFDRMNSIVPKAFGNMDKAMGKMKVDPDLSLYDTLAPEDFTHIANRYGADATAEYIQEMEKMRLKGGSNV